MGSGPTLAVHSDLIRYNKRTGPVGNQTTESIQKGVKGVGDRARDQNQVTQHQVGAGGGGLEAAMRALQKVNIRIRVLQEIKLTGGVHTHYSSG